MTFKKFKKNIWKLAIVFWVTAQVLCLNNFILWLASSFLTYMKTPSQVRKLEVVWKNQYLTGKNSDFLAFSSPDWFVPYAYTNYFWIQVPHVVYKLKEKVKSSKTIGNLFRIGLIFLVEEKYFIRFESCCDYYVFLIIN